jgi:hypothetical protein
MQDVGRIQWICREDKRVRERWNWDGVRYEEGLETTARNAFAKSIPLELIHEITGLDIDTLLKIKNTI